MNPVTLYPANMRRWPNVGLRLAHRLRRWANRKPTLAHIPCLLDSDYTVDTRRRNCVDTVLGRRRRRWSALSHHRADISRVYLVYYVILAQCWSPSTDIEPPRVQYRFLVAPGFCPASGVTFSCGHKNSKNS